MARNCHDGLVARLGLGQLGYRVVTEIVEPQSSTRAFDLTDIRIALVLPTMVSGLLNKPVGWTLYSAGQIPPRGSPGGLWPACVDFPILTSWET
jgi:hypothetical protein